MKLRTQVLLVLLLFAVLPLLVTVAMNLPQVLGLLNSLHRQVYLQDLRSDFRDLDQHLVSRQEITKLLSRLPDPGVILAQPDEMNAESIDISRAHYAEWINQILPDQLDVIEIQYVDSQGNLRFWLERDYNNGSWRPTINIPRLPPSELINETLAMQRTDVKISPIFIQADAIDTDPRRIMNLHLTTPLAIVPGMGAVGMVAVTVDIGGMAQHFNQTLWAYDDGRYLEVSEQGQKGRNAFEDYPGLQQQFANGKIFLWKNAAQQIIWVPLMQTINAGPLWVGRFVDSSSLVDFQSQLIERLGVIVIVLLIVAWLVARYFAQFIHRFGIELTEGISRLLEDDEKVRFAWRGADEIRKLGEKLTALSDAHVNNSKRILTHARELEKSNRYKAEFLANVSHELRTPLNSIHLLSKMLADPHSNLPADKAEQAKVIHSASRDLKNLIDDILDLSKIEAGRASLNLENVQLDSLLQDLLSLMQPQFDQKSLYLKIERADQVPVRIQTDPDKLRQILKNFLSNAVKFTESGGVTISLKTGTEKLPVCISIKDTGIGIARDKHELIFQAFRQADGSTSRRYGGTGLGLGISRELAHLLGGKIYLQSEPGQGAEFQVLLPLQFDRDSLVDEQVAEEEPLLIETQSDMDDPLVNFAGRKALIVDPDVKNLLALTTLLEGWGLEVTGAGDTEETFEALQEESFDLLLLDVMMSAENGYDTIAQIRNNFACEDLPLFALTSEISADQEKACRDGGASEYLCRPVDSLQLKHLLVQYLSSNEHGTP